MPLSLLCVKNVSMVFYRTQESFVWPHDNTILWSGIHEEVNQDKGLLLRDTGKYNIFFSLKSV